MYLQKQSYTAVSRGTHRIECHFDATASRVVTTVVVGDISRSKDDESEPTRVLFAVQDLAEQQDALRDFLQQHRETMEYIERARE